MDFKLIPKSEHVTTNWSGGTTTQLFIYPENASYQQRNFLFRISTATIEAEESVFTKLPGVSRQIMVLDESLKLEHTDKYTKTLNKFETDSFEGDWETKGFGKVTDFNLMTRGNAEGLLSGRLLKKDESLKLLQDNPNQFIGIFPCKGKLLVDVQNESLTINEKDFIFLSIKEKIIEINIPALEESELVITIVNLVIDL